MENRSNFNIISISTLLKEALQIFHDRFYGFFYPSDLGALETDRYSAVRAYLTGYGNHFYAYSKCFNYFLGLEDGVSCVKCADT